MLLSEGITAIKISWTEAIVCCRKCLISFRDVLQRCNDSKDLNHPILVICMKIPQGKWSTQIHRQCFLLQGVNTRGACFYSVIAIIVHFFCNKAYLIPNELPYVAYTSSVQVFLCRSS